MAKNIYVFGSFLMHHGKRGQKWGVRNGPPYPLDQDGKERLRKQRMESYGEDKTGMSAFLSQKENQRAFTITQIDPQGNKTILDGKNDSVTYYNNNPKSFDEACKKANWLRDKYPDQKQWNNNCVNCATSVINQKKGLELGAGPNADGVANEAIGYYFDGTKRDTPSISNLKSAILSYGPGSYGIMNTKTNHGYGHATVFEVDNASNIKIHDGQTNNHYSFDEYKEKIGINEWFGTSLYDLTNATPNLNHQFEDHACYPLNHDGGSYNFASSWKENGRYYYGPTKTNTTYEARIAGYGLR